MGVTRLGFGSGSVRLRFRFDFGLGSTLVSVRFWFGSISVSVQLQFRLDFGEFRLRCGSARIGFGFDSTLTSGGLCNVKYLFFYFYTRVD